jgi:hypothetical protein
MIQPFEGGAHPPTANQVSAVAVFAFVTCLLESLTDTTLLRFIQAISTAKLGHWVCLAVQIESHVWDGRVLLIHPPIDPRAFCPVATIRRLIDEASELAVHASSGTSTAMLGLCSTARVRICMAIRGLSLSRLACTQISLENLLLHMPEDAHRNLFF